MRATRRSDDRLTSSILPLLRRHQHPDAPAAPPPEPGVIHLDASELTGLFAAPAWLRDLGVMSWLFVGFGLLIAGLVLLAAQLATIVVPVILGGVLAAVAGPLVRRMERHRIPRLLGAVIVLVLMMAVGIGVLLMILSGLSSESNTISKAMNSALDEVKGWLNDTGITNTEVERRAQEVGPLRRQRAARRGRRGHHRARLDRDVRRLHRVLDAVHPQGRPDDAGLGRAPHGHPGADRADRHRQHDPRAAASTSSA